MTPVKLSAVGDICLGDHLLAFGRGVRSLLAKRGREYPFDAVRPLLARADLRIGNLECVLSDAGVRPDDVMSQVMRGAPAGADSLRWAGFDVLNVANNHTAQYGAEAYADTLARLRGAGIDACGTREVDGCKPVIRSVGGLRIGFLGYSFVRERYMPTEPPYAAGRLDAIRADIERLRAQVDCVVISCHWGLELIDRPSDATVTLARQLIDWGADILLGHHPHVFQAIERYRHGVICYSLGNFVFDTLWDEACRRSGIVEFELARDGGQLKIDWRVIPIRIAADARPVPMAAVAATRFREHLRRISDPAYYDIFASEPRAQRSRYHAQVARLERRGQWQKLGFVARHLHRQDGRVVRQLARKLAGRVGIGR